MPPRRPAAPVAALALLAACGGRPVSAPVAPSRALPPLEPAVLALPITVQTSAVLGALERAIPRADSLDADRCQTLGGLVCHQYAFRRDTLQLRVTGDRVDVLARLRYRGRVALPTGGSMGSCGFAPEPMPRAELRLATSLYWRADWRLGTRNTEAQSALPDPCEVTLLRVNATPLMKRIVDWQLGRAVQQVDSAFPALADLRKAADSLWREMQVPMAVDSAQTAWLLMNPESVGLAPLEGQGGAIRAGVTLVARPRIVTGPRPTVSLRPLPGLTVARPATGLRVPVQIELPFAEIGRQAAALLAAETAGQALRVTGVTVSGTPDSSLVRLALEGRMNGALTLVGRPRFDEASRTLVLDDLHYTLESRDRMTRLKATLGAPLIKRAIDQATGGGKLALGPQLDAARLQLTRQLNRPLAPDVAVGGGVRTLRVTGLHTSDSAFVVRVLLEGDAGLWVR
ncbi:DUF4403 family protein [Roseisolibacter sp. H3M3-2]|uniref:DUF4403 family protein n=1 Tax=Roseisolibacter sp. H3M3-2 TaxID=3031323 RepID=UPI0023DB606F|nr:DUF4403 family protein [Roseisolibacter sp. H3M3-2]MDF1502107.1 DUF4403 family protein [Roseisolibacter sp. H3M3-2]